MTRSSHSDPSTAQIDSVRRASSHAARRWHRLSQYGSLCSIVAPLLVVTPATATGDLDRGWWVVVGNGPEPGLEHPSIKTAIMAAAPRCGYKPFNDFSAKFSGFVPGYETFVIGAYPSRKAASAHLRAIKPCIPSAYIKYGRYAGE